MIELFGIIHSFLSKTNIYKRMIGLFAVGFGIISFIPIIVKMWKTKNADNFTNLNLLLAIISNILWIYYGNISNTLDNIISGVLYFFIYFYILLIKIFY